MPTVQDGGTPPCSLSVAHLICVHDTLPHSSTQTYILMKASFLASFTGAEHFSFAVSPGQPNGRQATWLNRNSNPN